MYQLHEVEGALELQSSPPLILPVATLYKINDKMLDALSRFQIYFILRRPRMSIDQHSLSYDFHSGMLSARVSVQVKDEFKKFDVRGIIPSYNQLFPLGWTPKRIWSDDGFPSTVIYIEPNFGFDNDIDYIELPLSDFLMLNRISHPGYTDFMVDYIGHSLGADGFKGAVNRLVGKSGKRASHEHLQKILVEINSQHPDQEIFIALFSYEYYRKLAAGGQSPFEPINNFDDAPKRLWTIMDAQIDRAHRIKIAEAALIRYFRPKFNETYKDTFPAPDHIVLSSVRQIDMTGLAISVDTSENGARFYTDSVEPKSIHSKLFRIQIETDRVSFFDLSFPTQDDEGGADLI